jgi:hypothetical protein
VERFVTTKSQTGEATYGKQKTQEKETQWKIPQRQNARWFESLLGEKAARQSQAQESAQTPASSRVQASAQTGIAAREKLPAHGAQTQTAAQSAALESAAGNHPNPGSRWFGSEGVAEIRGHGAQGVRRTNPNHWAITFYGVVC